MADDLSWIDHPANIRANAVLLRAVADQSLLHADEIERLMSEREAMQAAIATLKDRSKEYADEIERLRGEMHSMGAHMAHLHRMNDELRKVRDTADLLVNECEGGRTPPSLGILARLESALAMEHKARTDD